MNDGALSINFYLYNLMTDERQRGSYEIVQSRVYSAIRSDLEREKTEVLVLLCRDAKRRLIHREIVARGTLTELLVHPREVFQAAIRHRAYSAIVAHNHPSGDPHPSTKDLEMTEVLAAAGRVIGIELIDHLIIGKNRYISLFQSGLLRRSRY